MVYWPVNFGEKGYDCLDQVRKAVCWNMMEIGRVCLKTAGREAGKYCVVVGKEESGFVTVTGPKTVTQVKRRKCNITHLEPLPDVLKIKAGATDEEVSSALSKAGLLEKLGLENTGQKRHGSLGSANQAAGLKKAGDGGKE